MKKLIGLAVIVALLSFVSVAHASVGYSKEGSHEGQAMDINVQGNSTFDGKTLTIIANGHKDGVTTNVSTESNLTSAALAYGVVKLVFSKTKYVNLEDGVKGQMITFIVTDTTGAGASYYLYITNDKVSAANAGTFTGWDDIRFDAVGDSATLLWFNDTIGWILLSSNSVTIT